MYYNSTYYVVIWIKAVFICITTLLLELTSNDNWLTYTISEFRPSCNITPSDILCKSLQKTVSTVNSRTDDFSTVCKSFTYDKKGDRGLYIRELHILQIRKLIEPNLFRMFVFYHWWSHLSSLRFHNESQNFPVLILGWQNLLEAPLRSTKITSTFR